MPITFLGDIALPHSVTPTVSFDDELVIANLEGAFSKKSHLSNRVVYNDTCALDFLQQTGINAVSLANNHIYDLGSDISLTKSLLEDQNIQCFGAGSNIEDASLPITRMVDGVEVVVFAAGWDVIGCQNARANRPGVMPLQPSLLFSKLKQAKVSRPQAKVIFYIHWNYELEFYPQPAHRQLAFDLIAAGAWAIVGTHSHCPQGVERFGDGLVVHGLGNWMFPHFHFFNGKLSFPDISSTQLSCHVDVLGANHRIGRYHFIDNQRVEQVAETECGDTALDELTPYRGMSHDDYKKWFRANRRKNKLLPIYHDYRHIIVNKLKDNFVKTRSFAIDKMVDLGLKGGPK